MRIGQGFDAHRFTEDRSLVLGGVTIPHDYGLAGHSDADVLLHAVCDALLGAAGLGDLGSHFPDTDPQHADQDSRELVRAVGGNLRRDGWRISNIDTTVVAQRPRLGPHVADMAATIASDLEVDSGGVSVKATTSEGMGWTGRAEGIAALAVALLEEPTTP